MQYLCYISKALFIHVFEHILLVSAVSFSLLSFILCLIGCLNSKLEGSLTCWCLCPSFCLMWGSDKLRKSPDAGVGLWTAGRSKSMAFICWLPQCQFLESFILGAYRWLPIFWNPYWGRDLGGSHC